MKGKMKGKTLNEHVGKCAKDIISGIEGRITGFCQHITGCDQYSIMPQMKKGSNEYPTLRWIDCNRLTIIPGDKLVLDTVAEKGCDQEAPTNY